VAHEGPTATVTIVVVTIMADPGAPSRMTVAPLATGAAPVVGPHGVTEDPHHAAAATAVTALQEVIMRGGTDKISYGKEKTRTDATK